MLAHSPPLPLIINFMDKDKICALSVKDEEAILLALQDRARVRRIGLMMPATNLLKPIAAMDGQFPVLERLFIWPKSEDNMTLMLPTGFRATPSTQFLTHLYSPSHAITTAYNCFGPRLPRSLGYATTRPLPSK